MRNVVEKRDNFIVMLHKLKNTGIGLCRDESEIIDSSTTFIHIDQGIYFNFIKMGIVGSVL